ncbi:MAG: hypothetical protein ACHQHN_10745 [Sphingobacteriales bacterium]
MKKLILLLIAFCSLNHAFSQKRQLDIIADSISTEGKALYKSEFASWYGSDIFSEKCKTRRAIAGGYISYDSGNGLVNIFFTKEPNPKVLSTITFGYEFNSQNYKLDTTDREFTSFEKDLYTIRAAALTRMSRDTVFKIFKNASLNIVPLIQSKAKKVYVLTGPHANGIVLFGNDYLINFNEKTEVLNVMKQHKGLIVVQTGKSDTGEVSLAAIHSHLPGYSPYITATDICTLMLYEGFTNWNQNIVVSKDFVSIWDCKNNKLVIVTSEAWKKMNSAQNVLENKSH